jgi:hypothetical protein
MESSDRVEAVMHFAQAIHFSAALRNSAGLTPVHARNARIKLFSFRNPVAAATCCTSRRSRRYCSTISGTARCSIWRSAFSSRRKAARDTVQTAVAYPGRYGRMGKPAQPYLRDDALVEHLGRQNNSGPILILALCASQPSWGAAATAVAPAPALSASSPGRKRVHASDGALGV